MGLAQCADRVDQRRAWWALRAVKDALQPVIAVDWFESRMDDPAEARALHALYENKIEFYLRSQQVTHAPPA